MFFVGVREEGSKGGMRKGGKKGGRKESGGKIQLFLQVKGRHRGRCSKFSIIKCSILFYFF